MLVLLHALDDIAHVWYLFVIRHPRCDGLQRHLSRAGVEMLIQYPIPPYHCGGYADRGFRDGNLPVSEEIDATLLSLPIGPQLMVGVQEQVLETMASFPV
jgi:dTDP-4-amino-4,6-dideoxygalactose transaminase